MIFKQNSSPAAKLKKNKNSNIKFPNIKNYALIPNCYAIHFNRITYIFPCGIIGYLNHVLHLIHWVGVKLPFLKMWNHLLGNLNEKLVLSTLMVMCISRRDEKNNYCWLLNPHIALIIARCRSIRQFCIASNFTTLLFNNFYWPLILEKNSVHEVRI